MRSFTAFVIGGVLAVGCSSFGADTSNQGDAGPSDAGTDATVEAGSVVPDSGRVLQPTGANLTPSGDFEDTTVVACGPAWSSENGGPLLHENGGHDSAWFCQVCSSLRLGSFTFDVAPFAQAGAGEWFRATAWVRGDDSSPKTAVFTARVGSTEPKKTPIPLTDDGQWQPLSFDFQVPSDAVAGAAIDVYLDLQDIPSDPYNCLDFDDFSVFALQ